MSDVMDLIEHKMVTVISAATAWAQAWRDHGPGEITKMARDTFVAELESAVSQPQGAVEALRYLANGLTTNGYGEVSAIPGAINQDGLREARSHLGGQS
jgi:hypothetical protein